MAGNPTYLLDTNVFIQASKGYLAFDIAPTFWERLEQHASAGHILSIDRVLKELNRYKVNDNLKKWTNDVFFHAFASTKENDVFQTFAHMMQWVQNRKQFTDAAKAEFADEKNADGWLVAYAKVNGLVIVTNEVFNAEIKRKVPIPNVCQAFNMQYVDDLAMIRALVIKL